MHGDSTYMHMNGNMSPITALELAPNAWPAVHEQPRDREVKSCRVKFHVFRVPESYRDHTVQSGYDRV